MKVHVLDIEPGDTPNSVAQNVKDMIMKERPEIAHRKPYGPYKDHLVQLYIQTDMGLFPLVKELRKHLQNFMDENPIKNDPMVFVTTEYEQVIDKYLYFEGKKNGSGYREWCSYDKGEGY
jgi:hypothetical protein